MSEPFVKHDDGKLRFDLLDHDFEAEIAGVLTHGASKYSDNNWQNARQNATVGAAKARYYAAFRRHMLAWRRGEEIDPDSGQPHLACAACSLMFLRWYERNGAECEAAFAEELERLVELRQREALDLVDQEFDREQ
jgi:outer membrane receptor for Fe3+-dicitrate